MITKEMITAMIAKCYPNTIAEQLPDMILGVEKTIKQLSDVERRLAALQKSFDEAKKQLEVEKQAIMVKCMHYVIDYHADPAGGFDSYSSCSICGKIQ